MKRLSWIAIRSLLVAVSGYTAISAFGLELPGPVVDSAWLTAHRSEVQVVEVRSDFASFGKQPIFDTDEKTGKKTLSEVGGHLPGALLVDFKNVRADRRIGEQTFKFLAPERNEFEARMDAVGLMAGTPIVLVPVGQNIADIDEALRLYWTLKLYGERNVAMLDGGTAGWLAEGKSVTSAVVSVAKGNWHASEARADIVVGSPDVEQAVKTGLQLVDARPVSQFYGVSKSPAVVAFGHIDGAKNFAPELLPRASNGALYFQSPKAYRNLLRANGIDPAAPSITYCNTGHLASGAWFALSEIVGNHSTRLYDGSLARWTAEKRPLVNATQ